MKPTELVFFKPRRLNPFNLVYAHILQIIVFTPLPLVGGGAGGEGLGMVDETAIPL